MNAMRYGLFLVVASTLLDIAPAQAQYPGKPVRLSVPFPPVGGTDTLARILGQKLAEVLGQQVVVDDQPGAVTNIGEEIAAKAPPDGYTALMRIRSEIYRWAKVGRASGARVD